MTIRYVTDQRPEPGSKEWALDLCSREYRDALRTFQETQHRLTTAMQELSDAASRFGSAQKAMEAS